jgi:hypothetical protein
MERNGTNRLVKDFGARLQHDLAVENGLPFEIALMVEHLRRAESEMKSAARGDDAAERAHDACGEPGRDIGVIEIRRA